MLLISIEILFNFFDNVLRIEGISCRTVERVEDVDIV